VLVLDASVVIELLLANDNAKVRRIEKRISGQVLVSPDHMWLEVVSVVSRLSRQKLISELDAQRVIHQLQRLDIRVINANSFVQRIWALRKNVYYSDAAYVAIAESLNAPLLTCDKKLSKAPGSECTFELW
jgi:predicted nucleic acid-binding protein